MRPRRPEASCPSRVASGYAHQILTTHTFTCHTADDTSARTDRVRGVRDGLLASRLCFDLLSTTRGTASSPLYPDSGDDSPCVYVRLLTSIMIFNILMFDSRFRCGRAGCTTRVHRSCLGVGLKEVRTTNAFLHREQAALSRNGPALGNQTWAGCSSCYPAPSRARRRRRGFC